MKLGKWISAAALTVLLSSGNIALAQGKGHGKGHDKHGNDDDQDAQFYKGHDREVIGGWYDEHRGQLPPGLGKKDRLPPRLEKQLGPRWPPPPVPHNPPHPPPPTPQQPP